MKKRIPAFLLCLLLAVSVCMPTMAADEDDLPIVENGEKEAWSFPTISEAYPTVDQDTFLGKTVVLIFIRDDTICGNSNATVSGLVSCDWVKNENIQVIIVGCYNSRLGHDSTRETITEYKELYARDCEDIIFAYGGNRKSFDLKEKYSLLNWLAENYVLDADGIVRYAWNGSYMENYYRLILTSLVPEIAYWDSGNKFKLFTIPVTAVFDYSAAYEVIESVNSYRAANGLSVLSADKDLMDAAMLRAAEISAYFSHTRPDGSQYNTVHPKSITEYIGGGHVTAEDAMTGWKNSPGHNANILTDSHVSIGVGCALVDGRRYWVQCFSRENGSQESIQSSGQVTQTVDITIQGFLLELTATPNTASIICGNKTLIALSNLNQSIGNHYYSIPVPATYAAIDDPSVASVEIRDGKAVITGEGAGETKLKIGIRSPQSTIPLTVEVSILVKPCSHYWGIGTITVPASCTEDGIRTYTCSYCQETKTEPIPALGHDYLRGVCTRCHAVDPDYHLPGDINGDGKVSNRDLTRLAQHLAGMEVDFVPGSLDVNGDGRINNRDLTRLAQFLAGKEVELN